VSLLDPSSLLAEKDLELFTGSLPNRFFSEPACSNEGPPVRNLVLLWWARVAVAIE
jgi:hypothetical protein